MTQPARGPHSRAISSESIPDTALRSCSQRPGRAAGWALLAVAFSSVVVWASVRLQAAPQRKATNDTLIEQALQWAALEVEPAKHASELWSDPVASLVKLDETKAARIGVPLPGRVVKVYVELGSEVERGDPLFSVSSAELATLGGERRKAALDMHEAQAKLLRVSAIVAAHALPEREHFDAVQQLRRAESAVQLARAKENSLSVGTLSQSVFIVRAPRAGRVIDKHLLLGQQLVARSEQSLLTIADLSRLWMIADLFEADARGVLPGTRASVTVPALPNKIIAGEVDTVSAIVDPDRRTVSVRVRLDNLDRSLKVNMFAKAQFLVRVPEGTVSVAPSALGSDGERTYVYVRDAVGQFARRYVVPGAVLGGRALIHQGVGESDEVLVKGSSLLDNYLDGAR